MTGQNSGADTIRFVGRQPELDAFHSLRSLREQKNALYLEADGGLGKTRVLLQFVLQCQQQRRPWHVLASDNIRDEPVIDFFDFQNRTVDGLRRSMARRIGQDYFKTFARYDKELQDHVANTSSNMVGLPTLRLEVEQSFFMDFKRALREVRNYTVLFFDTFEIVHNRTVGKWLLNNFLPNPATTGCLIVFAGRPRPIRLPLNVNRHRLKPFSEAEAAEYFHRKKNALSLPERDVLTVSGGSPLLIDLIVHYLTLDNGSIHELLNQTPAKIESVLVRRFFLPDRPEYEIIQEMAYLRQHYNRAIYESLYPPNSGAQPYEAIGKLLESFPFIKHRRSDDSFALHDEFQRMMRVQGGRDWQDLAQGLYKRIVEGHYEGAINNAQSAAEKYLWRAEQLVYTLEQAPSTGIAHYRDYLDTDIRPKQLFEVNDLLWGEVADLLARQMQASPGDQTLSRLAYDLTREQADWLFEYSQYAASVPIYEQAISNTFGAVQETALVASDRMRLGTCYRNAGEINEAKRVFEESVAWAIDRGDDINRAWFEYNLGHIYYRQGRWREASSSYEKVLDVARSLRERDLVVQVLFVMARLHARQGAYATASDELERSLGLAAQFFKGTLRQGQALLYAGDVYRYAGDVASAHNYYVEAIGILEQLGGQHDWLAQAKSGLGSNFSLAGKLKRLRSSESLTSAIADQRSAFGLLIESLNMVRSHDLQAARIMTLDRLADVCLEVHSLEVHATLSDDLARVSKFRSRLKNLEIPEESVFNYGLRDADQAFGNLDPLGQAQRLFELAVLYSDQMHDPHQTLDSLIGAASIAQLRGRKQDLDYYVSFAGTLRGLDDPQQERIPFAVLDIVRGHLEFNDAPEATIQRYGTQMAELARIGGFGWLLARQQLSEIEKALYSVGSDLRLSYCKSLEDLWIGHSALIALVEKVRDVTIMEP